MIKVMYISHASTLGGAEQSLIDILKYIKGKVCPIVILRQKGAMEDILNKLGVEYYIFDYPQTKNAIGYGDAKKGVQDYIKTYNAALELVDVIQTKQIDLIHTNSTVVDVGAFAAAIVGKPHIWHFRELMEEDFNLEYQDKVIKKKLFENSTKCISISDCVYEKYWNTYHVKSIKISDGIDSNRFCQDVERRDVDNKEFYVAGSVSRNKGQMDAIKAIEILVEEGYKDVKLYIIGSISKQGRWSLNKYISKKKLGNNIQIVDFSYSLDMLRTKCLCSITTSKMEALGRVTVEAMLAGNIVIGANTGGTVEIIGKNSEYGFLYEQGNPNSLADKIKLVIDLPKNEKIRLIKRAQDFAKEKYDPKAYSIKLIDIYKAAMCEYKSNTILKDYLLKYYEHLKQEKYEDEDLNNASFIETLYLKMQDKQYVSNLKKKQLSHVAVYGIGKIGMELIDDLENSNIHIDYVIDQKENFLPFSFDYYKPYDELPYTEAIIITIKNATEIYDYYKNRYSYEIIYVDELFA